MTKLKISAINFKSMKVRLFCLLLLFCLVPSFIIRYGILEFYESREISMLTMELTGQSKMLANQMMANDYLWDTTSDVINAQLDQMSSIHDGRIMVVDKAFNIVKDTYGMDEGRTITSEEVIKSFRGEEINRHDGENRYLSITIPIVDSVKEKVQGVILVIVSTDKICAGMDYLKEKADMLMIGMSVLLFFLAVLLSIQLVKPFGKLRKSLENIRQGITNDELDIRDYSETKEISVSFNRLFDNMKLLDESRQEFVSNVSHELKTPLTSMKVLADSLLDQEEVPAELYKEFMEDIAQEIERENKIINDLLSLVKLDKSAATLDIAGVNINELLEQILKRLRPIAQKQNVELVLESFRPVTAEVDEVKLSLAITNLVENAIKYNKPEGWVHVTLNADYQYFYLTVEDAGIGIPEDSMEHIYERFYRVDKSHSKEIGGTGLGLAITRNSILMHRGAIKVHSKEGEGTTFSVRIPLSYIA